MRWGVGGGGGGGSLSISGPLWLAWLSETGGHTLFAEADDEVM
jgi:hypothetical protein